MLIVNTWHEKSGVEFVPIFLPGWIFTCEACGRRCCLVGTSKYCTVKWTLNFYKNGGFLRCPKNIILAFHPSHQWHFAATSFFMSISEIRPWGFEGPPFHTGSAWKVNLALAAHWFYRPRGCLVSSRVRNLMVGIATAYRYRLQQVLFRVVYQWSWL